MSKKTTPLWRDDLHIPSFPPLDDSLATDVIIVGGGITGLTSAYLLSQKGLRVAVVEAGAIATGTTGHTTAKITSQHGAVYHEWLQHFGIEKTKHMFTRNEEAKDWMIRTIRDNGWDCQLETTEAWLYAASPSQQKTLEQEARAYDQLEIPYTRSRQSPVPVPFEEALVIGNQAQFHPLRYVSYLIEGIQQAGGTIYEKTKAVDLDEQQDDVTVTMDSGHVLTGQFALIASHFPFHDGTGFYFARLHPERSYLLAATVTEPLPEGMLLSLDEAVRSVRTVKIGGEHGVLIGGEHHRTGSDEDEAHHFNVLHDFAARHLPIKQLTHMWSAQDYTTLDKLPYIGPLTSRHSRTFVATGYRKWGMTQSTMAAQILTDHMLNGTSNPDDQLFSPERFKADPSIRNAAKWNSEVAMELVKGKLNAPLTTLHDLKENEGGLIMRGGETVGAFRHGDGTLSGVSTACTHMGCTVKWNSAEHSWDCPCHGSRFDTNGEILEGPAKKSLDQIQLNQE